MSASLSPMKSKTKSKTSNTHSDCCDSALPKPRRSIPVDEVNKMIQREVAQVKSELTIYDDRNSLLRELAENEACIEHYEQCLHNATLNNQDIKKSLAKINLAIRRELELNA